MYKEVKVSKLYLSFGFSFKRFAIGFSIDKYHMELDLMFIWVAIEY
jgi:hypothetical protein